MRPIRDTEPDAVEKLEVRVRQLEAKRDRLKAYNRSCSAWRFAQDGHGDLTLLTISEQRDVLSSIRHQPYQCKNGRCPAWMLSNLSANIRRYRERLARLGVAA